MRDKDMIAIGRIVLAKRERAIMLQPWDKGLLGTPPATAKPAFGGKSNVIDLMDALKRSLGAAPKPAPSPKGKKPRKSPRGPRRNAAADLRDGSGEGGRKEASPAGEGGDATARQNVPAPEGWATNLPFPATQRAHAALAFGRQVRRLRGSICRRLRASPVDNPDLEGSPD
jgi:hypothetical protein